MITIIDTPHSIKPVLKKFLIMIENMAHTASPIFTVSVSTFGCLRSFVYNPDNYWWCNYAHFCWYKDFYLITKNIGDDL